MFQWQIILYEAIDTCRKPILSRRRQETSGTYFASPLRLEKNRVGSRSTTSMLITFIRCRGRQPTATSISCGVVYFIFYLKVSMIFSHKIIVFLMFTQI